MMKFYCKPTAEPLFSHTDSFGYFESRFIKDA